jgi:LPPG:FO 2-phospho-L-lactate transferase
LICPSNPVVSIAPILAVSGIRDAVLASDAPVVAVSPIVGGAPVKGPADRLLRGLGHEVSARGVAALYRDLVDGYILDERDAALEADIVALGLRTHVMDTIMRDTPASQRLAQAALELAAEGS